MADLKALSAAESLLNSATRLQDDIDVEAAALNASCQKARNGLNTIQHISQRIAAFSETLGTALEENRHKEKALSQLLADVGDKGSKAFTGLVMPTLLTQPASITLESQRSHQLPFPTTFLPDFTPPTSEQLKQVSLPDCYRDQGIWEQIAREYQTLEDQYETAVNQIKEAKQALEKVKPKVVKPRTRVKKPLKTKKTKKKTEEK